VTNIPKLFNSNKAWAWAKGTKPLKEDKIKRLTDLNIYFFRFINPK
jgi:hypothetical protein